MKLAIILTNDWELFGDGSGDYFEIQHNPTIDLLRVLKDYNAKITLMAEVFQQLKHLEFSNYFPQLKSISQSWEDIVKKSVIDGHDIQIHIHPQWVNARYENGKWKLNMNHSAISSMDSGLFGCTLNKAKDYLESLIKPIKDSYKSIAFRAGGYLIEPSGPVIESLSDTGILVDTTVTKGFYSKSNYDFRKAHSNIIPWYIDNDVNYASKNNNGILEFPIYSEISYHSPLFSKFFPKSYHLLKYSLNISPQNLKWHKKREEVKSKRYPKNMRYYKTNVHRDCKWFLNKIISKEAIQLDYDYLYPELFNKLIKKILINKQAMMFARQYNYVPVVASGHIKDAHNNENLREILRLLKVNFKDEVEFWTLSDSYNYFKEKLAQNKGE